MGPAHQRAEAGERGSWEATPRRVRLRVEGLGPASGVGNIEAGEERFLEGPELVKEWAKTEQPQGLVGGLLEHVGAVGCAGLGKSQRRPQVGPPFEGLLSQLAARVHPFPL